jgi:hypothetical protein
MQKEVAHMATIHSATGQGVKEINSRAQQIFRAEGEEQIPRLKLSVERIKKILGIIFVIAVLGYAIIQPWVSGPIIAYLRSIGFIQY